MTAPAAQAQHKQAQSVHTLVGDATLNVSLTCLPTLVQYSSDPIRLVIHEDGSLSESSREALLMSASRNRIHLPEQSGR